MRPTTRSPLWKRRLIAANAFVTLCYFKGVEEGGRESFPIALYYQLPTTITWRKCYYSEFLPSRVRTPTSPKLGRSEYLHFHRWAPYFLFQPARVHDNCMSWEAAGFSVHLQSLGPSEGETKNSGPSESKPHFPSDSLLGNQLTLPVLNVEWKLQLVGGLDSNILHAQQEAFTFPWAFLQSHRLNLKILVQNLLPYFKKFNFIWCCFLLRIVSENCWYVSGHTTTI